MQEISCAFNPAAGRERELELVPTDKPKRVFVIGGGPAGMEAARTLVLRGHQVTLFEKADKLGGQLNLAALPPGREEFANAVEYLRREMDRTGVKVRVGTEANMDIIGKERPEAVILATGAIPTRPGIPGIDRENVVCAWDVLQGNLEVGDRIVVIGGGAVGMETALFMARKGATTPEAAAFLASGGAMNAEAAVKLTRTGKKVTILEMLDRVGQDMGITTRSSIRLGLRLHNVEVITRATAKVITESGVLYERDGEEKLAEADTVVVATGAKAETGLFKALQGVVPEFYCVGDCASPRTAAEAIEEAALTGRKI